MELRQLKYFVRIVDLGSFSRAAIDLHVAQPALSRQLAALEDELGAALLARSPRGVTPTDAGLAFYGEAQALLRQLRRMPDSVRSAAGDPVGTVAVGMPFSSSNILAPALVGAVRERLPGIRLAITQEASAQLEHLLARRMLDLSLLYERERPVGQVNEQPLVREGLYLVTRRRSRRGRGGQGGQGGPGSPGGRSGTDVPLDEAVRERLVLPRGENSTRQLIEGACARAGLAPDILAEVDVPWTNLAMVEAGLGATIVSRSALYPERASAKLEVRRIVRPHLVRVLNLCTLRGETPSRASALVRDIVREVVAELVEADAWQGAALVGRRARGRS